MAVRDPETEQIRVAIYRQMTPQERITIAAQIYEEGIANLRSAIIDQHPAISGTELEREMRRRLLPRPLFHEVEAYIRKRSQSGV